MARFLGIVLAVAGIALLSYGISVSPGLGSKVTELLQGSPSEHALLLMAAGAGATALGFGMAFAGRDRTGQHP